MRKEGGTNTFLVESRSSKPKPDLHLAMRTCQAWADEEDGAGDGVSQDTGEGRPFGTGAELLEERLLLSSGL